MTSDTFTDDIGNEYAYTTHDRPEGKPTITHLSTCVDERPTIITTVILDNGKIMRNFDAEPEWHEMEPPS